MVSEYKGLLRKATNAQDKDADPIQMQSKHSAGTRPFETEPINLNDFEDDIR